MSHTEAATMKKRLIDTNVTSLERAVLIDMAQALAAGTTSYTWGQDRLAEAIGKRPGTPAAKSALSQRIIPSLIAKGLINRTAEAHTGRHAEYDLLVLHPEWVAVSSGEGSGCEAERVAVLEGEGSGLGATPPSVTATSTATSTANERRASLDAAQPQPDTDDLLVYRPGPDRDSPPMTDAQWRLIVDLHLLAGGSLPMALDGYTVAMADALIKEGEEWLADPYHRLPPSPDTPEHDALSPKARQRIGLWSRRTLPEPIREEATDAGD